ncbi:hypothetical protein Bca52824_019391 [Brassica carinata]|uniref:Tyrosine--tRNA ligase n=1 Tax=Brassica carinata TaxID=52824 RepID=A0A8X8AXC5_BRACI|nr:hypothetical protein Bca52824_019391 [Brassica carinata]
MAYATGVTLASRSIFPICSRTLLSPLRVASILESSSSTIFFTRVRVHQLFSTSRAPLFSSVKCSTGNQAASRPNVVDILEERGLLESITSENLRSACSDPDVAPLKVYCGFDPTAESLHLGNLLGIIVLSWFQRCGHQAVGLIGGATGRVGDPSGKSLERPELDSLTLEKNIAGIKTSSSYVIFNNYDWWKDMTMLDFLKNVGRFARVGPMMAKESVKKRLESEQGMSYTEFTYQLLQGYDFVHLLDKEGVNVQIGGSDQWDRRSCLRANVPLLLKNDGTKFGKSEDGAIWLSPSMLSPYKFYQYFFSVPDVDVIRFLKTLTFLSLDEIKMLEDEMRKPGFVHGEEGLKEAMKATEALRPGAETKLDWNLIERIAEDIPTCSLAIDKVSGVSIVDVSVSAGLFESKSAARRMLKQGGVYMNNERVDDENLRVEEDDIVEGKGLVLSSGKKNKVVIRIS